MPQPTRIAVFRALQLGDMLCAIPALRALRTASPHAEITLIGLPWAQGFVARYPRYIDEYLSFPGFPGLPEQHVDPRALTGFLNEAHAHEFDLAIQLHGDGRISNLIVALLGAQTTAGFYREGEVCPDASRFLPYPEREPEIRRLLSLTAFLGAPAQGETLEFVVTDEDRWQLSQIPEWQLLSSSDYVCVHPGARSVRRRWSVSHFAAVADALAVSDVRVVLTGGPDDREIAQAVADRMRAPSLNFAGRTSLGALAALLDRARLLVCNDTGVSHLADALGVPSVVVFTGSDASRWSPLDLVRHRAVVAGTEAEAETLARVVAHARELLETERAHAA